MLEAQIRPELVPQLMAAHYTNNRIFSFVRKSPIFSFTTENNLLLMLTINLFNSHAKFNSFKN